MRGFKEVIFLCFFISTTFFTTKAHEPFFHASFDRPPIQNVTVHINPKLSLRHCTDALTITSAVASTLTLGGALADAGCHNGLLTKEPYTTYFTRSAFVSGMSIATSIYYGEGVSNTACITFLGSAAAAIACFVMGKEAENKK